MGNRYFTACGDGPEQTKAYFYIQGPQEADQIPEQVIELLDLPGITQVDIRFNHGTGDKVQVFQKIKEQPNAEGQ